MYKNPYKCMIIHVYIHTDNAGLNTKVILIVVQDFIWAGVLPETYTKDWDSAKSSSAFAALPGIGRRDTALMSHPTKRLQ